MFALSREVEAICALLQLTFCLSMAVLVGSALELKVRRNLLKRFECLHLNQRRSELQVPEHFESTAVHSIPVKLTSLSAHTESSYRDQ